MQNRKNFRIADEKCPGCTSSNVAPETEVKPLDRTIYILFAYETIEE